MTKTFRIDIHAHAFPRVFLQRLAQIEPERVQLREREDGTLLALWNKATLPELVLSKRLAAMTREGVITEVLSAPPVYGTFDSNTGQLCSLMNELQKDLALREPGRFYGFMHLPYHDQSAALSELRRYRYDPAFVGVMLASNMNGWYPDASLDWLWRATSDAGLPIFVHPVEPVGAQSAIPLPIVHFPSDTTVFAAHMILSGTLQRFPKLQIILAQLGGSLSVLGSRLNMIVNPHFPPHMGSDLPHGPSSYVRRFYVDTAQGFSEPAYAAAVAAFGQEHMLYGSDHYLPEVSWRREINEFLDPRLTNPALHSAVMQANARSLLRIPASKTREDRLWS